ncbi:YfiR family protein [Methyloversatilis thermotolerans]|uniref:YfiR family protein n=1 Tax=Methyloversatilis thermotolerans TaxID=1346290 RepID=UPI00035F122B|nr:YfiR family protein [Methyloversatilis thermotolerans]
MTTLAGFLRCLGSVLLLLVVGESRADAGVSEEQLKAAFVFNFAKYVEWPSGVTGPVVACTLGSDAMASALLSFEGRPVSGRSFQLRRVSVPDDVAACNVVVLSDMEPNRMEEVLRRVPVQGVLTVSDIDGFTEAGGMIAMMRVGDRLQFEINNAALQRANLKASSQLLKLARNLSGRGR